MPEKPPPNAHLLRLANDPLGGRQVSVRWVQPGAVHVGKVPKRVQNWDYYDGAVVGVGIADGHTFKAWGSGVMVAPGLVLTAIHVIADHVDAIEAGTCDLYCVGVRSGRRTEFWALKTLRYGETKSDIALLGVELRSEIPDDWHLSCLPITTRQPRRGETLTVSGFRFDDPAETGNLGSINDIPVMLRGDLYISKGKVARVFYTQRDSVMLPFPAIEIMCGSLGAMSGSAVLDQTGALVGILSTGLTHDDREGPSNAAWIIQALMFKVNLIWPPGLYAAETAVVDLPDLQIKIIGRDKVRLVGPYEITYEPWR